MSFARASMVTGLGCVPVWISTRWQSTEASRSPCGPPVRRAWRRAEKSPRDSSRPTSEEPSSCTRAWLRTKHPSSSNALAVGPVNNNQCSFHPIGPGPYPWLTPGKSRMIAGAWTVKRLLPTVKCPDPSLTSTMAWLLRVRPAKDGNIPLCSPAPRHARPRSLRGDAGCRYVDQSSMGQCCPGQGRKTNANGKPAPLAKKASQKSKSSETGVHSRDRPPLPQWGLC